MFPFDVSPGWYATYWDNDPARPKRRSVGDSLARFAVLAVLLAGSGLALSHFHTQSDPIGTHDWEQE
jgi:hypothetical protein